MKPLAALLCASLPTLACAAQPATPANAQTSDGSKPVGAQLLRDVDASTRVFEIGENQGRGLGDYSVRVDGQDIWPPSGEGCETLIGCCEALVQVAPEMALSCQLAMGRDGACVTAQGTVRAIALEQGMPAPSECGE